MVEGREVSEGEINLTQLSQEEMTQDEIKELVKKAINSGIHESMFILTLNEWKRPGNSFRDYGRFQMLYGKIEAIEINNYYDYPTTNETVYAIIPKSRTVIILFEWANDYQGKLQEYQKLYVFSYPEGWRSLDLS